MRLCRSMQINANMDFDQKWSTIFCNNWDFETEILLALIASSKGQLCQEPNNVSKISYSPYLLIFEQIEQIGCVIKLCRKFPGMCQTIGLCAVSQTGFCSSRGEGGALNGRGKQTFCCTWLWFILLLTFWNGQFRRKRMWKLCNFTQRGVKLHKYGQVSIAVNQVNRDARLWMGRWSLSPGQTGSSVTYQRRITPPMTPSDHHYWPIAATPFFP